MQTTLKVTPTELTARATELKGKRDEMEQNTAKVFHVINELNGNVWSGKANKKYTEKFNSLKTDVTKMYEFIDSYVANLKKMALDYQRAETINQTVVQTLGTDLIK